MPNKDGECGEDNVHEIGVHDDGVFSETPILCRVFGTVEEAYHFYNDYAKRKGFGICK